MYAHENNLLSVIRELTILKKGGYDLYHAKKHNINIENEYVDASASAPALELDVDLDNNIVNAKEIQEVSSGEIPIVVATVLNVKSNSETFMDDIRYG
mgnify:FL=1